MTMTLNGATVENLEYQSYLETVIHRAIYCNRDDVNAVVHPHTPELIPFTVADTEIKPVFRLAALFHEGVSTFSEYDVERGFHMVTEGEGARMAEALADKHAQLLENHGVNDTGASLKEASWRPCIW